jgi:pimeloyl-ACP methyl ester carboxylesterase
MKRLIFISLIIIASIKSFGLKPERDYRLRPENYALIYKELNVITNDGFKIKTWFFPAQDSVSYNEWKEAWKNPVKKEYKLKYNEPRPTIIICNGDAGNMSFLIQYAKELVKHGYNVVTFDWRGFGESDNWKTDEDHLVYVEYLSDYNAVLDEVLKQAEVDDKRIGLYGFSTGAYLSFAIFSKRIETKAYVGRALLTNFESSVKLLKIKRPEKNIIIPENYPVELMPEKIAGKIEKPCFLIVGELDDITPVSMSLEIFNSLKGDKQLWVVKNATHGGAEGPDFINFKKFMLQLKSFYDANL